jgi:MFS family permease
MALSGSALGLGLMAGWRSVAGLFVGTAVFAAGMSLLYPALMLLALTAVPETERGSVVGTFSSFFDLSQGLGALILGGVAALSGYRGAFAGGAVASVIGLLMLQLRADIRARGEIARERARAEAIPA